MKNKSNNLHELRRLLLNAFINAEVSQTEVDNFFHYYLEYIFNINHLDINKYDITISKVVIDENNNKREKSYKNEANQENRKLIKEKVLTKHSYKAKSDSYYFDALMFPHPTVNNKFTIAINKNACHAKSDYDMFELFYLFFIFGHEVHHIVQYIKRPKEMDRYDYLQELHELYINKYNNPNFSTDENKKLKSLVAQHLNILYSNCNSELFAEKKGYDYLDMLFNDILETLPTPTTQEECEFINFLLFWQERNESNFISRMKYCTHIQNEEKKVVKQLQEFGVEDDLLTIN